MLQPARLIEEDLDHTIMKAHGSAPRRTGV